MLYIIKFSSCFFDEDNREFCLQIIEYWREKTNWHKNLKSEFCALSSFDGFEFSRQNSNWPLRFPGLFFLVWKKLPQPFRIRSIFVLLFLTLFCFFVFSDSEECKGGFLRGGGAYVCRGTLLFFFCQMTRG